MFQLTNSRRPNLLEVLERVLTAPLPPEGDEVVCIDERGEPWTAREMESWERLAPIFEELAELGPEATITVLERVLPVVKALP